MTENDCWDYYNAGDATLVKTAGVQIYYIVERSEYHLQKLEVFAELDSKCRS
jgi:hypothetical protein